MDLVTVGFNSEFASPSGALNPVPSPINSHDGPPGTRIVTPAAAFTRLMLPSSVTGSVIHDATLESEAVVIDGRSASKIGTREHTHTSHSVDDASHQTDLELQLRASNAALCSAEKNCATLAALITAQKESADAELDGMGLKLRAALAHIGRLDALLAQSEARGASLEREVDAAASCWALQEQALSALAAEVKALRGHLHEPSPTPGPSVPPPSPLLRNTATRLAALLDPGSPGLPLCGHVLQEAAVDDSSVECRTPFLGAHSGAASALVRASVGSLNVADPSSTEVLPQMSSNEATCPIPKAPVVTVGETALGVLYADAHSDVEALSRVNELAVGHDRSPATTHTNPFAATSAGLAAGEVSESPEADLGVHACSLAVAPSGSANVAPESPLRHSSDTTGIPGLTDTAVTVGLMPSVPSVSSISPGTSSKLTHGKSSSPLSQPRRHPGPSQPHLSSSLAVTVASGSPRSGNDRLQRSPSQVSPAAAAAAVASGKLINVHGRHRGITSYIRAVAETDATSGSKVL